MKDQVQERLEALERERRHYETHGMKDRLEAVDAEVQRLRGGKQTRPAGDGGAPAPARRGRSRKAG